MWSHSLFPNNFRRDGESEIPYVEYLQPDVVTDAWLYAIRLQVAIPNPSSGEAFVHVLTYQHIESFIIAVNEPVYRDVDGDSVPEVRRGAEHHREITFPVGSTIMPRDDGDSYIPSWQHCAVDGDSFWFISIGPKALWCLKSRRGHYGLTVTSYILLDVLDFEAYGQMNVFDSNMRLLNSDDSPELFASFEYDERFFVSDGLVAASISVDDEPLPYEHHVVIMHTLTEGELFPQKTINTAFFDIHEDIAQFDSRTTYDLMGFSGANLFFRTNLDEVCVVDIWTETINRFTPEVSEDSLY